MELLTFDEYSLIIENNESTPIEVDLDDDLVKLETGINYTFLGITFKIVMTSNTLPYLAIIKKDGMKDGKDLYWGKIVKAKSLSEMKKELRVEIKLYNQKYID